MSNPVHLHIIGHQSGVVTLMGHSKDTALAVSSVINPDQEMDTSISDDKMFYIPLNQDILDLDVSVLKHTQPKGGETSTDNIENDELNDDDHVYDDTISVIEKSEASIAQQISSSMSRSIPESQIAETEHAVTYSSESPAKDGSHYVNVPQHQLKGYEEKVSESIEAEYEYSDEEDG